MNRITKSAIISCIDNTIDHLLLPHLLMYRTGKYLLPNIEEIIAERGAHRCAHALWSNSFHATILALINDAFLLCL